MSDNVGLCIGCADSEGRVRFPTNHDPSHIERLTAKLRSLAESIREADLGGTKSYLLSIYPSEVYCKGPINRILDKHRFKVLDVSTTDDTRLLIGWDELMTGKDLDLEGS